MVRGIILLLFATLPITVAGEIFVIEYNGFQVWLDCTRRGAIRFEYTATVDRGNLQRDSSFYLDSNLPANCQQTSTDTYSAQSGYDRGHLVPANHLDHLPVGIVQSNFMTNILPQAKIMNRGAWKKTENLIECYRDLTPLRVIGGVFYGFNPHDDFFLASHGIQTPDYFWKVVIAENDAIAWVIPNSNLAWASQLDYYLIRIRELEQIVGEDFGVNDAIRDRVHQESWPSPPGCDLS